MVYFQLLTYGGFYDANLEFVGLEGVQIVASMNAGSTLGRHKLSTRFTSVVRICSIGYVLLYSDSLLIIQFYLPPKGAKVYPASRRRSSKRVGLKGQLAPHCVP